MDANKKREITFEDDRDSKFAYKFKFSYLKFCYQWFVACLANFSKSVTSKLVSGRYGKNTRCSLRLVAIFKNSLFVLFNVTAEFVNCSLFLKNLQNVFAI